MMQNYITMSIIWKCIKETVTSVIIAGDTILNSKIF